MLGSPGWRTPDKGAPHRSYPTQRSPSYGSSERSPPVYSPKRSGVLGHRPLHSGLLCAKWIKCRSTIRPNHKDETGRLSELSNEATLRRRAYELSHVEVVRTS